MNRDRIEKIALGAIAVFMLPTGLQAAFMPELFFDDFPFGRGWVSAEGGAYNEHLVRDVGALFIAMVVITVWSLWRRQARRPVAVAWLVQGTLHFMYHIGHLDDYESVDKIGMLASLAAVPLLAAAAFWAGSPQRVAPATETEGAR